MEKGILGDHPIYPSTGNPYDSNLLISILTSFAIGLLVGIFEVSYVNGWFQNKRFYKKIFFKSVVYIFTIILATVIIISLSHAASQGLSPFSAKVWSFVGSFFSNFAFWSIITYYSLAIVISLFYKEVSDNMGPAVSLNFFTGKYHKPTAEHRVFMFVDMKSSTTYAEQLGHIRYFEMLKEYYHDISQPILEYGGEIYQYVGDEIVITWNAKNQLAIKALRCFFAMKEALHHRQDHYENTYGVVPTFKAGLHFGNVTTGEIGSLKKDIVFTGDTLNTAARIQSLCNDYQVDILVSESFLGMVEPNTNFKTTNLGAVQLRGRNEPIQLYSVHPVMSE